MGRKRWLRVVPERQQVQRDAAGADNRGIPRPATAARAGPSAGERGPWAGPSLNGGSLASPIQPGSGSTVISGPGPAAQPCRSFSQDPAVAA